MRAEFYFSGSYTKCGIDYGESIKVFYGIFTTSEFSILNFKRTFNLLKSQRT